MNMQKSVWQCQACQAKMTGDFVGDAMRGKGFHRTPTGGECRAANFTKLAHAVTPEEIESGVVQNQEPQTKKDETK